MFDFIFKQLNTNITNTLEALQQDLSKISLGQAKSDIFELLKIDCYGSLTPLPHIALISLINSSKLTIEPYDKSMVNAIEKAIKETNLDFNIQSSKTNISVFFPQLTLERRDKFIKLAKQYGEDAKISLRNHRRTILDEIKNIKVGDTEKELMNKKAETIIKNSVGDIEELTKNKVKKLQELK